MAFCRVTNTKDAGGGMGEDENSGNNVSATIDAVTGLAKAVPIYEDIVQPVAKQLGKSLETVGKLVNVALAPVGLLVWGYDKCENFINTKVADRLKNVPPEEIITPKPNVAGPAIEALRYTGHEESLSDMYASLLASAMDKRVASGAHPAFVEIIKQLTSDEAKLIKYLLDPNAAFPLVTVKASDQDGSGGSWNIATNVSLLGENASVELPDYAPSYIDNLCRLGLIEIRENWSYSDPIHYAALESSAKVLALKNLVELQYKKSFSLKRGAVHLTSLGKLFGGVCIRDIT